MELVVTLLTGIAWPIALVWVAYLFKGELRSLMHRVSHLKYKDIEAKFESTLADAEAKVIAIDKATSTAPLPDLELNSRLEQLRRIADISPRAAIMEAWVLVEDAAGKSRFFQGAKSHRVNPKLLVKELVRLGKLPPISESVVDPMREIRNQVAHISDFDPSQDIVDRYLQVAVKLSEHILKLNVG
jgi:hypothetical protein